jgi:hypothetical protein
LKGSSSTLPDATDITLGSNLTISGTILDVNTASLSGSFLPLSGGTMTGGILQPLAPSTGNSLANKTYVDAQVAGATIPDATTLVKGKVQLAGDLGGVGTSAAAPIISNLAITNPKVNPGGANTLKGTNSLTNVDDIILGSGLSLTVGAGPTLSVNSSSLSKAGAAQFGVVEFDPSGDLNATAANSGIAVVKPLSITLAKMTNLTANPRLIGSSGTNAVSEITLGGGLSLTGGILAVVGATIVQGNVTTSTTLTSGTLIFGLGTNGLLTVGGVGGIKTVLTQCAESDGLGAGAINTVSAAQSGGTYAARDQAPASPSTVIIGSGAQRNKDQIGEGATISMWNVTDNVVYEVRYWLTSAPPTSAFVFTRY